MYFNVVVKDNIDICYEDNQLVFHFGEDFEEALKFAEKVLRISDYNVEILQFYNEDKEEEE